MAVVSKTLNGRSLKVGWGFEHENTHPYRSENNEVLVLTDLYIKHNLYDCTVYMYITI